MTSTGRKSRQPQDSLSDGDRAVWELMAKTLTPLRSRAAAPASVPEPSTPPQHRVSTPAASVKPPRSSPESSRIELPALGRRDIRRLRKGRVAIEAKLDLHGMRLAEAHSALRRFLVDGYDRHLRWVLVITGKGSPAGLGSGERGALRRSVPAWLEEPALRAIVLTHRHAEAAHGGEGALYVQLRKRRPG